MDFSIHNRGYHRSFTGLYGKEELVNIDNYETGIKTWQTMPHYPFKDESAKERKAAIERRTGEHATTITQNGFGTQIYNVRVYEAAELDMTKAEYSAYRRFKSSPDVTNRIETDLTNKGLSQYLNKGTGATIRKTLSKIFR